MKARWLLIAIAGALALGACGVKPKSLEPPYGAEDTTFPRTYPSPETDAVKY